MKETYVKKTRYGAEGVVHHDTEMPELEMTIALDFVVKWGMVAAIEDGEDSSGRQKLRLLTPVELVDRAYNTAKLLMGRGRTMGLVHNVGTVEELGLDKAEEE